MNASSGIVTLNKLMDLCNETLITILTVILAISCILALLLMIPTTIQYIGSIMQIRSKTLIPSSNNNETTINVAHFEENLYRYRILFNVSVFLTIMGSSLPLLIQLINTSHQNNKKDETTYEYIISLWGVCQVYMLMDIGGRIFFAWIITIPTIIICFYFIMKKSQPDLTFKLILIFSLLAHIFAYTTPIYFILNLWIKKESKNGSYFLCQSQEDETFYQRIQLFELLLCHFLPVMLLLPSIVYTWFKMRFVSFDIFYEPIIFVSVNIPFLCIDIMEQISMTFKYDISNSVNFANFFMLSLLLNHLSYTCMFLVAPIRSVFQDGDDEEAEKFEISNVYQVLIQKKSIRQNLKRQLTIMVS